MEKASTKNNAKLSIIMPFYNHKELVEQMIDSILANDFQDWELLAIDDGSDNNTLTLFNKYKDQRIKLIKRTRVPKGAQTCRNIGMQAAKGSYLVFFDSDDYIAPYCLRQRVEAIEAHQEADVMVFPSGTYVNGVFHQEPSLNTYGYHIYEDDIQAFAAKNLPYIVWNNIYRTKSLMEKGITWDEKLLSLQDSDFNLQVLLSGLVTLYASNCKPDYAYRIEERGKSVSNKISSQTHLASHIYHIRKDIQTIQERFGHRYDNDLHEGILLISNRSMTNGLIADFADKLVELEKEFKMKTYFRYKLQTLLNKKLNHVFPPKIARQISMLNFLLRLRKNRKQKVLKIYKLRKKKGL